MAGALKVLAAAGAPGLPSPATLDAALLELQGSSDDELSQQVMFGAPPAPPSTRRPARPARRPDILTAATLARGVIESGELMPNALAVLGMTRARLLAALPA